MRNTNDTTQCFHQKTHTHTAETPKHRKIETLKYENTEIRKDRNPETTQSDGTPQQHGTTQFNKTQNGGGRRQRR